MNRLLAQFTIEGDKNYNIPPIQIEGVGTNFDSANIGAIVGKSLSFVFAFAGIGLLLMIIRAGFTLMMSAGDAKKLASGKAALTNAIVGFLLVFSAFWIVQIAGTIFGWDSIIGPGGMFQ